MKDLYQHIAVDRNQDILIFTIVLKRITQYDLAEAVGKELLAVARQEQAPAVVVDMRNVEFMSSVGYGPLITLRGRVRDAGGRLVLCNLSRSLKEMFETTRLLINPQSPKSLFEYSDTLEGAMAMLS